MADQIPSENRAASEVFYHGYGLDDSVRTRIFARYERCLDLFEENQMYISEGYMPKKNWEFIGATCGLFLELMPKFGYGKKNVMQDEQDLVLSFIYSRTFKLTNDLNVILERVADQTNDDQALMLRKNKMLYFGFVKIFIKLRVFLESNGITKYERKEWDREGMLIRGAADRGITKK